MRMTLQRQKLHRSLAVGLRNRKPLRALYAVIAVGCFAYVSLVVTRLGQPGLSCAKDSLQNSVRCKRDRFIAADRWQQLPIDYVGLVAVPSCVTTRSIVLLNELQRPRDIYLIVPAVKSCQQYLGSLASNVHCISESDIVPGLTRELVSRVLRTDYPGMRADDITRGRSASGWYLQQILKLAAVHGLPQLSEYYVIWDFDMLPVRRIPLLYAATADLENVQTPVTPPLRTAVNIGGARARGYAMAYQNLLGARLEYAHDGTSFVTHWVVAHKPLMFAFLAALQTGPGNLTWIGNILENLPADELFTGFSEYASYISWVKQHHPETQHILRRKTWMRQPLGGDLGIWLAAASHWWSWRCCPTMWQHWVQWAAGLQYYGFELGHHAVCRFHRVAHPDGTYGL